MMRNILWGIAGLAFGIALVVACGQSGSAARASPSDCAAWQVGFANFTSAMTDIPPGWEPFAMSASGGTIYTRRCKP
jgi:hypothetical protein